MAQFPSLPLWTDAYLADTRHLTDAEHGIYLQLLMLMWRCPECRVPNDDRWLARQLTRSEQAVIDAVRPIINEFCKTDGNWITQGRLKDEWLYLKKRSKAQSGRAKSRWVKEKPPCPGGTGKTDPAMPPTLPTPTPLEKKEPKGSLKKKPPRPEDLLIDDELLRWRDEKAPGIDLEETKDALVTYCKAHGKKYKDYRAALQSFARRDHQDIQKGLKDAPKRFDDGNIERGILAGMGDELAAWRSSPGDGGQGPHDSHETGGGGDTSPDQPGSVRGDLSAPIPILSGVRNKA